MAIERINPSSLGQPGGYHHVVKDGKTVYLAGQVARDKDGKTVGVGDAAAQAEQVFRIFRRLWNRLAVTWAIS